MSTIEICTGWQDNPDYDVDCIYLKNSHDTQSSLDRSQHPFASKQMCTQPFFHFSHKPGVMSVTSVLMLGSEEASFHVAKEY